MPQDRDKQRGKASVVDGESSGHSGGQNSAPRKLTAVACVDCRKRKRKCNGERPSCSACQTRGLHCIYDVVEGATRTEDLKQRVQSLTARVRNLETCINKLRYSTDNEASAVLAQLRLGDSVDVILGGDVAGEAVSDISEVEQWRRRRHSKDHAPSSLQATSSTFGSIGLAQNPTGPSLLTSIAQHEHSPSERSASVVTNSPGMVDGVGTDSSQHDSPWAPSLFVEVDSQHLLYEDDACSEPLNAGPERFPLLDGETPDSVQLVGSRERIWIDPALTSTSSSSTSQERHTKYSGRWKARRQMLNEARLGGDSITISSHLFSGIPNIPLSTPVNLQLSTMQDLIAPAWSVTSMYHDDDPDMMSRVYIDFIIQSKRLIASGVPPERLFGLVPDVEALLSENAFHRASGLSQWTARLANSFGIASLPCRIAVMWIQWHLMRWIIHPTPETYITIPDWYRPTPYQMFVPHPVYVDFHIWPRFRDVVIQRMDLQSQQKYWYSEAAKTVDCNWTGGLQDAMFYNSAGKLTCMPAFIGHIMDLGNWTIGPCVRKHIPDADTVLQIEYGPM